MSTLHTHAYSHGEEIAHSLTAAIGVIAMLIGIPWLVVTATEHGGAWRVIGALAFGAGALMMFGTSTLYHAARRPALKSVLRKLDHSAIYVLIAGTYTPFTIGVVRGSLGWSLFGIVWALAVFGVIAKMAGGLLRIPLLSTALYVIIGWIGVVAVKQLWDESHGRRIRVVSSRADSATREACRSTCGNASRTRTWSGICSCSAASPAISSRSSASSARSAPDATPTRPWPGRAVNVGNFSH